MKFKIVKFLIVSFLWIYTIKSSAESTDIINPSVLDAALEQKSKEYFEKEVKAQYSEVIDPIHGKLLRKIANKLSIAAGYGQYTKPIFIGRAKEGKDSPNAFVLPGGQVVFTTALIELSNVGAGNLSNNRDFGGLVSSNKEGLLAAVMGHELGHYYGKHQLRSLLRKNAQKSLAEKKAAITEDSAWKDIRFEQEFENESDLFAYQLLSKAGYNPRFTIELLKLFKAEFSADNPYLSTHPSNNERLSKLETNWTDKNYYERMSQLEYAFGSVETGTHLDEAVFTLKKELETYKSNPYLLSTLAKVYHRMWEKSCPISDLRFKTSIISNPFQDEMLHEGSTKGDSRIERKFWCDKGLYLESLKYYELSIANFAGPHTLTSYSALLAYHPTDYKLAMTFANLAMQNISDEDVLNKIRAINNLGIVFYFNEKYEDSLKMFYITANASEKIKDQVGDNPIIKTTENILKKYSDKNMGILDEGLFNLGAFFIDLSRSVRDASKRNQFIEEGKKYFAAYSLNVDSESEWGKYAYSYCCELESEKFAPTPKQKLSLSFEEDIKQAGGKTEKKKILIELGSKYSEFNQNYNSESEKSFSRGFARGFARGYARGFARGVTVFVENDTIKSFSMEPSDGVSKPVLSNGIEIGMLRKDVEKKIGKPPVFFANEVYYPRLGLRITYNERGEANKLHVYKK